MLGGFARWLQAGSNCVSAAFALREYLKKEPPSACLELIARQVGQRQQSFLDIMRRAVFEAPVNPYQKMLAVAGCNYGDLEQSVSRRGLESTLKELRSAGVYLTQEEFKGKTPIVRAGREIPSSPASFQNPLTRGSMPHVSSGSRGNAVASARSSEFTWHQEAMHELVVREFQLGDRAQIILRPVLPSTLGLQDCAIAARKGHRVEGWYATGRSGPYEPATRILVGIARAYGCRVPWPKIISGSDFSPPAELVARLRKEGVSCMVSGPVSPATRLAAASIDRKLDIHDTLFLVSGETLTEGKADVMMRAGGHPYARYGMSEVGFVGHGCRRMKAANSVHLYSNAIAAITHRRREPLADADVDSLFFTTLLPSSPHVFVNFEAGDSGVLEEAGCDCEFSRAGMRWCIREVSSFGKMTGHGVTILGTDLVRLLEEILPSRLGGHPGDYQLVERETATQTILELRVNPRATDSSIDKIRARFMEELGLIYGGALARRILQNAEVLNVVLDGPFATSTGKVHALHLLRAQSAKV